MRERSLIANDNPVERRLLDRTVRSFGHEPTLALLDDSGHVRALADIEAEAIRFAISHYRGQMSEIARRLHIGRSTLYRKLDSLGLDAEISDAKAPAL
jgi:DNA-binding NtrC family response regulator